MRLLFFLLICVCIVIWAEPTPQTKTITVLRENYSQIVEQMYDLQTRPIFRVMTAESVIVKTREYIVIADSSLLTPEERELFDYLLVETLLKVRGYWQDEDCWNFKNTMDKYDWEVFESGRWKKPTCESFNIDD